MISDPPLATPEDDIIKQLDALEETSQKRALREVVKAAIGAIPWVGAVAVAGISYREGTTDGKKDDLIRAWLEEHKVKFERLGLDLSALGRRLTEFGEAVTQRMESKEYLDLVRQAFRTYDKADTDAKRNHVCKLIANAAATKITEDDIIRLFLEWIERYNEIHFIVLRAVYQNAESTRADIWDRVYGKEVREDSPEADLFRLIIDELSQGRIIRQHREKDYAGNFLKAPKPRVPKGYGSRVYKSAFDDEKPYEATALGAQFLHYVFEDVTQQLR